MLRLHVRPRAEVLFEVADGARDEFVLVRGEGDEREEADSEEGPSWVSKCGRERGGRGENGGKMGRRKGRGKDGRRGREKRYHSVMQWADQFPPV